MTRAAPRTAERFTLTGPTVAVDRRVAAARTDLADVALAGCLFAPHYAGAIVDRAVESAMMLAAPDPSATAVSQILPGEAFAVLDRSAGWAWGYSVHDHYVGYVRASALAPSRGSATHRVAVQSALRFARADIKAPVDASLSFAALVDGEPDGDFLRVGGGFLHLRHVTPVDAAPADPVESARLLLDLPYLWGGRGAGGIDCSGLVQVALAAAGIAAPRDSDQQRALGRPVPEGASLEAGDLVFMPGHVGLMVDEAQLIHANAHWMRVTCEPLADVLARAGLARATEVRRLP